MLGWSIGRIGCFLAGDVIGKPTDFVLGIVSPAIDVVTRHPVAGYEVFVSIIIFAMLLFVYKTRVLKDGLIFFIGFALYFAARFGIEFIREYREIYFGFSASQILLIVLFVLSVGGFIYQFRNSK